MQRTNEKEMRHVELKNYICSKKKEKTLESEKKAPSASRGILLSTVQYLYVHPIVWTEAACRADDSKSSETVRTQHTLDSASRVGAWTPRGEAPPFALLCFPSCRAHAAPASEVSGSLQKQKNIKRKKSKRFYIWVYIHIHTHIP